MFMGIRFRGGPIGSYADAVALLASCTRTPTGRQRKPKGYPAAYPLGAHRRSVTTIREGSDGSIVLRLYDTDVVEWHRNNTFTVNSWASKTTGEFVDRFTPLGIHASFASRNGAPCTLSFRAAGQTWREQRICHGDATFREVANGDWQPVEGALQPFRYVELDRKATRALSREHNLADFTTWLSMAPRHLALEHRKEDCSLVADFLRQRDFRSAAIHLPLIQEPSGFGIKVNPLPIATRSWSSHVTMRSIQRFRDWLYDAECALDVRTVKVMTRAEFDKHTRRNADFDRAGAGLRLGYGW